MSDLGDSFIYARPEGPVRYMTIGEVHEDGAARYMAHARRQLAEGQMDHAACSLKKAAHKAKRAQRYREMMDLCRQWPISNPSLRKSRT